MKRSPIIQFAICAGLLLVAYIPMIGWMVERWNYKESYYSHGYLIPIVSLFIVFQRRHILKNLKPSGSMGGLWIVVTCLFVHIVCATLKVYFLSGFSFVIAIYGLVMFFFGREMARNLTFPIFFLFAMVPFPMVLIQGLTVKMKLFVAQVSTVILNNIGFPSIRDGSIIRMPNSFIAVEAPCSGLRSLISLMTLGLLFAYAMKTSFVKKSVLFVSSIPIAFASNIARILMLATINDLYGQKVAMGFFHDFSGYMVFVLAFLGLLGVGKVLEGKKADFH